MSPSKALTLLHGTIAGASGNLRGMSLMVLSTGCMAAMYVCIRMVPGDLHPFEVALFRNLIAWLLLWVWYRNGILDHYRTTHLRLHFVRGSLNVVAMLMFFHAVLITPLANVAALGFTAPLFASLLAFVWLRERPAWHRVAVILFGFVGAIIILRPGAPAANEGPLLLLISSAIWAVTMIVIKVLARTESSVTIALYMVSFMTPMSFLAALLFWQWPDMEQLAWLTLIAAFGTVGQISLAQSFRVAEVTAVLPLDFLKLVWSALLGYFLFAEIPDVWAALGGAMIFASTTFLALREYRRPSLRQRPGQSGAATTP